MELYEAPQQFTAMQLSSIAPGGSSPYSSFGGFEFGKNLGKRIRDRFKKPTASTQPTNTNNNADTWTDDQGNNYKWNPMTMTYEINN